MAGAQLPAATTARAVAQDQTVQIDRRGRLGGRARLKGRGGAIGHRNAVSEASVRAWAPISEEGFVKSWWLRVCSR